MNNARHGTVGGVIGSLHSQFKLFDFTELSVELCRPAILASVALQKK